MTAGAEEPEAGPDPTRSHEASLPRGDRNRNPDGIGFFALLREDYATHERRLLEPGFLAVAVHRFGNARMGVRLKVLRAPLTLLYCVLYQLVNWIWGIDLPYVTRLGRRVRIWHHGGIVLGARSIGDDVHIRQNTTFGIADRHRLAEKPIVGSRVDVGAGACILGAVTVGDDSTIGANSVVLKDVPPGAVVMGVPARPAVLSARAPGAAAKKAEDGGEGAPS